MTSSEEVVQQLNELFGNSLNLDLIRNVAQTCSFDVCKSSNQLLEMSNGCTIHLPLPGQAKQKGPNSPVIKKSRKVLELEHTIENINKGYKVLVLLRGLPGSGKSTLAKYILQKTIGYNKLTIQSHTLSTDDYFMKNGVYRYEPSKLQEAHGWNHQRAFNALCKGYSPVIIDNTNTEMWEMKPYAMMATDYGYLVAILEPDTHWCFNEQELVKRNKHGVSKGHIRNMLDRFEKNVTPAKLLSAYDCKYRLQKPPQIRLYPPYEPQHQNSIQIVTSTLEVIDSSPEQDEQTNLMEFTEFHSASTSPSMSNSKSGGSVDDMLIYQGNSPLKTGLLKPVQADYKPLYPDIEKAWGVNEQALRSWDIVTPLNETRQEEKPIIIEDDSVETCDFGVNTYEEDFYVLTDDGDVQLRGMKIVQCYNRDINRNTTVSSRGISKKTMLDKSCLTEDDLSDQDRYIEQLSALFPDVPQTQLLYWFRRCKGDIEWTIELLLTGKEEAIKCEVEDSDEELLTASESTNNCEQPKGVKHKRKSPSSSEESLALKKYIEEKVTISDNHYSEHLLKIKNLKFGNNAALETPGTSKEPQIETIVIDSDSSESEDSDFEMSEEETMELYLGDKFVQQLETNFGEQSLTYPKGFQPVVQIPVTLAKQLYTFYIESVFQQMEAQKTVLETMVREDAEFARKLQENEIESISSKEENVTEPQTLREIMTEQAELSKIQKEAEKWKELTPDNLAARLTRQKLFSVFPSIDKETLVELLHAHDNVYKDTVETLLASTGPEYVGLPDSVKDPPIDDAVVKEMREAHDKYNKDSEEGAEQRAAVSYREEAAEYSKRRNELYENANRYQQRGMWEVAMFYSSLASQQTSFYERANSRAAMAFLDEHASRLQDFNTLDLHYLFVKEAVPALDMFIDRNINLLRQSKTKNVEYLQVITGRGKRSENGRSKIKPVVKARLKRRQITYQHLNPGLLKFKITKNSLVTSELANISDKNS